MTAANAVGCLGGVDSPPESFDTVDTWTTVPTYEIGSLHGEDAAFRRVSDVRLGDEGKRIYVADSRERQVTVWTPDGTSLFSVGGDGEGPGEFRDRLDAVHVTADGFQVRDRSYRFVVFSLDGHHLATVPVPLSVSYRGFCFGPLAMLEDGSLLAYPSVGSGYQIG